VGLGFQIKVWSLGILRSGRHGPFPGRVCRPLQFPPHIFDAVFPRVRRLFLVFAESALNEASKWIICWPIELLACNRASCFGQFVFVELALTLAFMIDEQPT